MECYKPICMVSQVPMEVKLCPHLARILSLCMAALLQGALQKRHSFHRKPCCLRVLPTPGHHQWDSRVRYKPTSRMFHARAAEMRQRFGNEYLQQNTQA